MKYIITGKRGSHADKVAEYISRETNKDVEFMFPTEINKLRAEHKVVYIHIPLLVAWDWIVTDPYNNDLRQTFVDEIMEFRELKKCDLQVEYDGCIDQSPVIEKIIMWME